MITVGDLPLVVDSLSVIRSSIDNDLSVNSRRRESSEDIYLRFEQIRIRFISRIDAVRIGRSRNLDRANDAVLTLYRSIGDLVSDSRFQEFSEGVRIVRAPRPMLKAPQSAFSDALAPLRNRPAAESRWSVLRLLDLLLDFLKGGVFFEDELPLGDAAIFERKEASERLKRIIPAQKIAPVQFDIVDGQLSILESVSSLNTETRDEANSAKEELVLQGEALVSELRSSNCDRRLIAQFETLQAKLIASENIIQLGIANIACGALAKTYSDELPVSMSALLQAHTMGVSMFVAQYPDWIKFSENAAAANVGKKDIASVDTLILSVVDELEDNPHLAKPEVPKTLRYLSELIRNPESSSKRAAFAVIRTLENFISKVFQYGIQFADLTAKKTIKGLSNTTSGIAIGFFLSLAVTVASQLSPIASKIEGMSWIVDAATIVSKHILDLGVM